MIIYWNEMMIESSQFIVKRLWERILSKILKWSWRSFIVLKNVSLSVWIHLHVNEELQESFILLLFNGKQFIAPEHEFFYWATWFLPCQLAICINKVERYSMHIITIIIIVIFEESFIINSALSTLKILINQSYVSAFCKII